MSEEQVMSARFGYIRLSRKAFAHHKYWRERRVFSKWEAMLDLFQLAPWKDVEIYASGHTVTVPRGHVLVSVRMLAARWKWSNPKVSRFVHELVHDETLCTVSVTHSGTVYRVVNYELYQTSDGDSVTPDVTDSERAANTDLHKKKEDKTDNPMGGGSGAATTGGSVAERAAVASVIAHYQAVHPRTRPDTESNRTKVRARLREGFTAAELCDAIDGNARDSWHVERRKHEIEYVLRNSSQVDRFRALAAPKQAPPRDGEAFDMIDWQIRQLETANRDRARNGSRLLTWDDVYPGQPCPAKLREAHVA